MNRKEVNINELSPMLKQYMEIKDKYEDALLFFRLGDFYELFFEDGLLASRELELTLTGKNGGLSERIPMCGVPHHAVKAYIEKLVNKGYKVAICEQVSDPKDSKGVVKREVVQVISKGTIADLELLDSHSYNYVGSILDFKHCYVLTISDVSAGRLDSIKLDYDEDTLINEIIKLNIKEVVIKSDFDLKILNNLKNIYGVSIIISDDILEDKYEYLYEDENDFRVVEGIKHLIYFLVISQLKDISHFDKVNVINTSEYLEMDSHTVRNLELTETLRLKDRQYSLIWLIDKAKTAMGSRMLKSWLIRPLKSISKIRKRHETIEILNNEFIKKENLRNLLYEIYDIERLCGKLTCGSINARDLLQFKRSLKVIPDIKRITLDIGLDYNINDFKELYNLLEMSIYEEPPISIKEGYLIKRGYNKELDELHTLRSGGKDFIASLEQEERIRTGIKTLKVGFNKVFGYYIEISKGQAKDIDPSWGFERRQTLTSGERFITPLLKEKEALVLNAEDKIVELEYNLFCEIKEELKKHLSELKEVSEKIAQIDALVSLSVVAEENSFVKPNLSEKRELKIINNRHPVVEKMINGEYVANDIIMDEDTKILLITGPNMAGKSTYMRQLAITIILGQMGSFVPADEAILPVYDKIFTRIGASDDLVSGESTFMVEMIEARNAICNASENSLILFDELGRGTATYDGMSLAQAILEYVSTKIKCTTLFSTHYHELTALSEIQTNIKNVHVKALEENGNVIFLHKVSDGAVDRSYGIHVAALAKLPAEVINRASDILTAYESNKKGVSMNHTEQLSLAITEKKEDNEIIDIIKSISPLEMTPMDALNVLYDLKKKAEKEK